jgi:hypothetical protein
MNNFPGDVGEKNSSLRLLFKSGTFCMLPSFYMKRAILEFSETRIFSLKRVSDSDRSE